MATNAIVKKENIDKLKVALAADSVQEQFKNALKNKAPLFIASLIDLVVSDDSLAACAPNLVIAEALKAATLDLPINKSLGFAYVIPYNKSVKVGPGKNDWEKIPIPTFVMGYKGYIQLAQRSGQYRYINADVVYDGEFVSRDKLTGEVNVSGTKKSDLIVGYLAYFELLNGFRKSLYWTTAELTKHAQQHAPSYNQKTKTFNEKSTWATDFEAMAKKTMIRNLLSKFGVMSIEMQIAFNKEEDTFEREVTPLAPAEPDEIPTVDIDMPDANPPEQILPEELGDEDWPIADKAAE